MDAVVPLRRNAAFQLLWIGSAVSQVGSELTRLAMPLLVLALTGSPGWAGVVAGARIAASIVAQLPAGVWVDRWDRRRTLVTAHGGQVLAGAVLGALILADQVAIWHLVVAGMADGVCSAFAGPARTTAIRGVVPVEQLPSAYAQEEARNHAARLAGPPLGALLYGLGRAVPFVVDALTYLVALLCAVAAKVPRRPAAEQQPAAERAAAARPGMGRELLEAVGWLWRQRGLRAVVTVVMMLNLLGSAFLLPLILFSLGTPAFNVVISVVITRMTPETMLGRVDAVLSTAGFGLAPLGPVLGGALAGVLGGAPSVAVIGGALLLTGVIAGLNGDLRRFTGEDQVRA